jgi:hypothetical protein
VDVRPLDDPAARPPPALQDGAIEAAPRRGRILGIDVARAAAIIGMVMVHVGPVRIEDPTLGEQAYALVHGRASVLFVLLAGVGVSLLAGNRGAARLRGAWARLCWNALLLLPLGLVLQNLDHGVRVILQYYAVYFLVAGIAMHLGDRLLLGVALAATVLSPALTLALFRWRPSAFDTSSTSWGDPLLLVARQLLVTGSYPVLVWGAPLLFGVWLGRRGLATRAVRWRMLGGGAVLAVVASLASTALVGWLGEPVDDGSWLLLATDDPHSEMPLWVLGSTGSATAVLGGALLLAERLPRLTWPLAAFGQLAFTVYVGHLLVLDAAVDLLRRDAVGPAALSVARFAIITVLACALWRWLLPRGPLEALLRLPWTLRRRSQQRGTASG